MNREIVNGKLAQVEPIGGYWAIMDSTGLYYLDRYGKWWNYYGTLAWFWTTRQTAERFLSSIRSLKEYQVYNTTHGTNPVN